MQPGIILPRNRGREILPKVLKASNNSIMLALATSIILALLPSPTKADLPNHCYYAEIPGVWEYSIGRLQPKEGFTGKNYDTMCGMPPHRP